MAGEGSEQITAGPESRSHLRQMLLIGAVSSVIGIAVGLAIDWFPTQASVEGEAIDTLWDVLIIFSVPVFVLVEVVVLYSVWRFRMRPGQELKDGPPIHGNTRLEIIWTAIPAVVLVCLCSYAYVVLIDIEEAEARALNVRVVGEQFTWTFHYRGPDGEAVASSQLYVPRGRQINFTVQSKDVLHDFWVPAFRMKIDAVPGIDTHLLVTPKRIGQYPVVCAELCGLGHSVMRQTAHVVSPADFETWLQEREDELAEGGAGGDSGAGGGGAGEEGGDATAAAAGIFTSAGCGGCHALADAGTQGGIGPNLDESLQGRDADYIRAGIVEPNAAIAEGFSEGIMPPNYGETLPPGDVDALVEYLASVTEG